MCCADIPFIINVRFLQGEPLKPAGNHGGEVLQESKMGKKILVNPHDKEALSRDYRYTPEYAPGLPRKRFLVKPPVSLKRGGFGVHTLFPGIHTHGTHLLKW
jgi:hypothetical protein